jgi:Uma2 family endonuclease
MEIFKSLPESNLAEIINNVLYVSEPATVYHQRVSGDLTYDLMAHVRKYDLGEVLACPGIYHGKNTVVIPDIVFVSTQNKLRIHRTGLYGAPDLVIEILSPSTKYVDLHTKKDLFEEMGVKEYWLIHPDKKKAHGFLLERRKFGGSLTLNSKIHVRIWNKTFKF